MAVPFRGMQAPYTTTRLTGKCAPAGSAGVSGQARREDCANDAGGRRFADLSTGVRRLQHSPICPGAPQFGVLRENRRQEAASHGSVLFGFGVDLEPLADLGVIAKPIVRQLIPFG
jgi:hypothetical protein